MHSAVFSQTLKLKCVGIQAYYFQKSGKIYQYNYFSNIQNIEFLKSVKCTMVPGPK